MSLVHSDKWKEELNQNGFILCQKGQCGMGFLSIRGMEAHVQTCYGVVNEGDFVSCTVCKVRFKTFLIMDRHRLKAHKNETSSIDLPVQKRSSIDLPNIFSDVDEARVETAEDLRLRILAESRRISTVRKPGRPRKYPVSLVKPFIPTPKPQINLPKPPMIYRRPQIDERSVRYSESNQVETNENEVVIDKERALAIEEARLKEYQERVMRYERLAEDATRVALEEKEQRLKKLAEELRQREIQAREKLASAYKTLEVMKSSFKDKPIGETVAEQEPEVIEGDDDDEMEESDPNDKPSNASAIEAASEGSAEDEPVITVNTEENMIVVTAENAASLASLFGQTDQGEVTLLAQEGDDGNFILVGATSQSMEQDEIEAVIEEVKNEEIALEKRSEQPSVERASEESPVEQTNITEEPASEEAENIEAISENVDTLQNVEPSSMQAENPLPSSDQENNFQDESPKEQENIAKSTEKEQDNITEQPKENIQPPKEKKLESTLPELADIIPVDSERKRKAAEEPALQRSSKRRKTVEEKSETSVASPRKTRNSSKFKPVEKVTQPESPKEVEKAPNDTNRTRRKSARHPKLSFQTGKETMEDVPVEVKEKKAATKNEDQKAKKEEDKTVTAKGDKAVKGSKSAKDASACGKCGMTFDKEKDLKLHVVENHGGIMDENQPEDVILQLLRDAFSLTKRLNCYKCNLKSFASWTGLKYHLKSCGKSKVDCDYCDFQGLPVDLKAHMSTHKNLNSEMVVIIDQAKKGGKTNISCSKCDETFSAANDFQIHVANAHGGVLDETRHEKEILMGLKEVFNLVKSVHCYRCKHKSFTSFLGLKYHLNTCGKSKEQLHALLLKCDHCDYRGRKINLKIHMSNSHSRVQTKPEEEEVEETFTSSGRKRRSAASKASKRMSMVLESTRIDADFPDDDLEDDDDEFKVAGKEMFKQKNGKFECRKCDFSSRQVTEMEKHIIDEHEDLDEEDDEEEGEEEVEPSSAEEDENDDDIGPIVESGGGGKSKKSYSVSKIRSKGYVDLSILQCEKQFRKVNYYANDFAELKIGDFRVVDNDISTTSPQFVTNSGQEFKLKAFESITHDSYRYSFFAGGPIIASDWCPNESFAHDILALATQKGFDSNGNASLIQLWTFSASSTHHQPSFKAGFRLDLSVHCLKWCPSLKPTTDQDSRLGLLAASCSDGTVKIFTIGKSLLQLDHQLVELAPALTLQRYEIEKSFECFKLDWYRGKEHRLIAASFSDGFVAIWDLSTKSPMLRSDDRQSLLPIHCFRAHAPNERSSVVFSQHEEQIWPSYLITGSTDRKLIAWSLTNPRGPFKEKDQYGVLPVTDMKWISHYKEDSVSVSFDDACFICNTRSIGVCIDDIKDKASNHQSILLHNSSVWSLDFSPLLNVFATSTSSGEVLLHVGDADKSLVKMRNSKSSLGRRNFLFKSSMNVSADDPSFLQSFEGLNQHYPDLKVNLHDRDMQAFAQLTPEEIAMLKEKDYLPKEDFRKYPLLSVNRVNLSPRVSSRSWIFTGAQSGLARLFHVPNFNVGPL